MKTLIHNNISKLTNCLVDSDNSSDEGLSFLLPSTLLIGLRLRELYLRRVLGAFYLSLNNGAETAYSVHKGQFDKLSAEIFPTAHLTDTLGLMFQGLLVLLGQRIPTGN